VATSVGHADLSLDDAITVALEGLDVARSSGSDAAVHTELYELVARAREWEAVTRRTVESPAAPVEAGPTAGADDPFAHMPADEAAAPADTARPPAPRTPARDRAALAAEMERLHADRDDALDLDRHARALFERRIAKLAAELERAEAEIERLREERAPDPGLPSVYREVQGLDESSPLAPVKRRLIEGVFRKNTSDESPTASRQWTRQSDT
jgi:hypothetical protein